MNLYDYLCCPECKGSLKLTNINVDMLHCMKCKLSYDVVDGIPRFTNDRYNANWDYKWTELAAIQNFKIIDKEDPAFKIHNVFRFFELEEKGFYPSKPKRIVGLDVGCGVGQYSISLLDTNQVHYIIALDLTRGVDVGKKYIEEHYPQYKDRILFVQADARSLPIKTHSIYLGMALASIHHSGDIDSCLSELVRVTKKNHRFMVWIYTTPTLEHYGEKYRTIGGWFNLCAEATYLCWTEVVFAVLRRLPNKLLMLCCKFMASDTIHELRTLPLFGKVIRFAFPAVCDHPDKAYRLINLYDGYSPKYSEHYTEYDVVRWSKEYGFKVVGTVPHRLGWVGEKR